MYKVYNRCNMRQLHVEFHQRFYHLLVATFFLKCFVVYICSLTGIKGYVPWPTSMYNKNGNTPAGGNIPRCWCIMRGLPVTRFTLRTSYPVWSLLTLAISRLEKSAVQSSRTSRFSFWASYFLFLPMGNP